MVEATAALFQPELEGDGHASHVADLEVTNEQVRYPIENGFDDHRTGGDLPNRVVTSAEDGPDFVADGDAVTGNEDVRRCGHGFGRLPRGGYYSPNAVAWAVRPLLDSSPSQYRSGGHVLDIQLENGDGYVICRPVGELDAFTVSQFRQSLAELASNPRILIDMSGVPFVDSAGLGALIGGIRRARELGGDVAVACNRPTLTRLLHTTGFDRIVTVTETVEDAVAALLEPSPESS